MNCPKCQLEIEPGTSECWGCRTVVEPETARPDADSVRVQRMGRRLTKTAERTVTECKCSLRIKLVGDGCAICNPELAEYFRAQNEESPTDDSTTDR